MNKEESLKTFSEIAKVIENDSSMTIKNHILGDVIFANGTFGNLEKKNNGRFGIKHIIEGRYRKDNLSKEDISVLLYLIKDAVETGTPSNLDKPRLNIRKNGIFVSITKQWLGSDETWVITGFAENDKNNVMTKEATDAIKAVNAQYGYAPEFFSIGRQVGAVIAFINKITQNQNLSNQNISTTQSVALSKENGTMQLFNQVVKLTAENRKLEEKVKELTSQLELSRQKVNKHFEQQTQKSKSPSPNDGFDR